MQYISFSISSVTSNSIRLSVTPESGRYYHRILCRLASSADVVVHDMYGIYAVETFVYTISGLQASTAYAVNVGGNVTNVSSVYWMGMQTATTDAESGVDFAWTYAGRNLNTGAPVTGPVKRAGLGLYITAGEWNELAAAINGKLGAYVPTVAQNATITAAIVNYAARALGVAQVRSGDPITAAFFNSLKDAYNAQ